MPESQSSAPRSIASGIRTLAAEGSPVVLDSLTPTHEETRNNELTPSFPADPGREIFHGLAGEVVERCLEGSEASAVGLLGNLLVWTGNVIGSGPHLKLGATVHPARLYVALVGDTAKARKTDASQPIRALVKMVDPRWVDTRVKGGVGSGEGIIWDLRDQSEGDAGAADRRLMLLEPELARVLAVMQRQGSTLSPVLREAWDSGILRILTKNSPATATGAHVGLVGNITVDELRRVLDDTSYGNGFANRILWLSVRRSKEVPIPPAFGGPDVDRLGAKVAERVFRAREVGEVVLTSEAREVWEAVYHDLSAAEPGLVGSVVSRRETQALRLALTYCLLDGKQQIQPDHLFAALEFVEYVDRSVQYIFGRASGDPVADAIMHEAERRPSLDRTAIHGIFGRNQSAARISTALAALEAAGKLRRVDTDHPAPGRPAEVWELVR